MRGIASFVSLDFFIGLHLDCVLQKKQVNFKLVCVQNRHNKQNHAKRYCEATNKKIRPFSQKNNHRSTWKINSFSNEFEANIICRSCESGREGLMRDKESIKHTDEWKQMKKSWEYFISSRSLPMCICFTLIMFKSKTTGIIEHQSSCMGSDWWLHQIFWQISYPNTPKCVCNKLH